MAISRLTGQDTKAQNTTGNALTATYSSTPTQGNLLIATVFGNGGTNGTIVGPSGWSTASDQPVGNTAAVAVAVYYKVAGASESTSVTVSQTGAAAFKVHAYEYSGCATSSPLSQTTNGNSGASAVTSQTTNSLAINGNELLFVTAGEATTITSPAWSNGFNLRQQDSSVLKLFDGDLIEPGVGSFSSAASWTTSSKSTAIICAFSPLRFPLRLASNVAVMRTSVY